MTTLTPPELINNLQASDVSNDSTVTGTNVDDALETLDSEKAALGDSNTFTVGQLIDGTADEAQLTIQGHTTQTNNLLAVQTSAGADLLTVANSGNVDISGALTLGTALAIAEGGTGATSASAARTNLGLGALATEDDVDLTSEVTGILPGANGGTGNGFFAVTGPTTSLKTFTLPDATSTILTDNADVTVAQGGTGRGTATAYAVLCGGTTSTGAHQSVAGLGTSGQVLTSNGAGALPTFQAAGGGGSNTAIPNSGYKTDNYYRQYGFQQLIAPGFTVTADRLYVVPFAIGADETFTRIGLQVGTAVAGSARLGIYDFADGEATNLVLDAGTVSTSTTGAKEITISQALTAGFYAVGAVFDAAPTVYTGDNTDGRFDHGMANHLLGFTSSSASGNVGNYMSHTFGALPDPYVPGTNTANPSQVPMMWLRKV